MKSVYRYLFSFLGNREADIGDNIEKGCNFEQRERKYAKTWGAGGHARCEKSLQRHIFCTFLYLKQFASTPVSLLCASKVANNLRIHNFNRFDDHNNFRFKFSTTQNFQNAVKETQFVHLGT